MIDRSESTSSQSSLHDSELSDLINYLDMGKQANNDHDDSSDEKSFHEFAYAVKKKSALDMDVKFKRLRKDAK